MARFGHKHEHEFLDRQREEEEIAQRYKSREADAPENPKTREVLGS